MSRSNFLYAMMSKRKVVRKTSLHFLKTVTILTVERIGIPKNSEKTGARMKAGGVSRRTGQRWVLADTRKSWSIFLEGVQFAVCPLHPAFKSDLKTRKILYSSSFVEQKDLILDFNLYLCEKFGYRNSCSVMQNANGFCVNISERDLDCYIRFLGV